MWRSSRAYISSSRPFLRVQTSSLYSHCADASIRGFASSKRPDAATFELLIPAIRTFHDRLGHFLVPYNFPIAADDDEWPVETRGVNIGRRLHAFLTNPQRRKQFPQVLDRLQALGFPVHIDYKQFVWEKRTLAALRAFYRLYGHSLVPVGFVIPDKSTEFPRETWGFTLGRSVATLREHEDRLTDQERKDLEALEFSFSVDETHWQTKILPALRAFRELYGHGFVKRDFVVPESGGIWPTATRGVRLGFVVHNIRCHGAYGQQVTRDHEKLKEEGWIHLCGSPEDEWKEVILPALRQFHASYGHGNVPATFVVPSSSPWPPLAWGFALGQLVHTSHSLHIYHNQLAQHQDLLDDLGVTWFSSLDHKWDQLILPALKVYAQVYGTETRMPVRFIVPSELPWPESAWGLRLGEIISRMRTRNHFEAQRIRDQDVLIMCGLDRVLGTQ